MKDLGRVLTAMVTPFKLDGHIDFEQAGALAKALIASGSDGVVVLGTTGESPTIWDWSERECLIEAVVKAVDGKGTVIVGAGDNCTEDSEHRVRQTTAISGVDGLLVPVPYYNKPTQDGMKMHFGAISYATDLPCIMYNIPGRTGVNMTAETTLWLANRYANIIGIKEASGKMDQVKAIIKRAPRGFRVWSGNDEDTFHVVNFGGYGVISVASHLVGRQIAEMIGLLVGRGHDEEAYSIHSRLAPLIEALFCVTNPIPIKFALNGLGFYVGGYRLPLCEPDETIKTRIMEEVKRHQIDLLVPLPR